VLSGEAGVGKSSLVALERAAAVTDVIEGSCLQLAGQALPLAALEQIFDARGGWPDAADGAEQQSAEQRLRAIRVWADALAPTGSPTPTTVVIDDLQWADETTCDFLVYLASTAARRRLSLVLTLRDDETPLVGRVQQAVAELTRLPGAECIELQRLDREETRELVAVLAPDHDPDAWYEQTQGNPYLLGELVKNDDYSRIITSQHYRRLTALVDDAERRGARVIRINPAQETCDEANRVFPPTLLTNVTDEMAVMQEEIFGPVLPIREYTRMEDAIAYVNARPHPLALYYFEEDVTRAVDVIGRISAGGVTINDCVFHVGQVGLPFGGVGASGMGRYHGFDGFETFSHKKGVFVQRRWTPLALFRPPYGATSRRLLRFLLEGRFGSSSDTKD